MTACGLCGSEPARVQTKLQLVLCDRCASSWGAPVDDAGLQPPQPVAEDLAEALEDEALERLSMEE